MKILTLLYQLSYDPAAESVGLEPTAHVVPSAFAREGVLLLSDGWYFVLIRPI